MLNFTPSWWTAVFLARIVIPFSRSRSIESITRSATSWPLRKAPDCHSIASTRVVLPWSTWATIAMFLRSARRVFMIHPLTSWLSVRMPRKRRSQREGKDRGAKKRPAVRRASLPLSFRKPLRGFLDARGGRALRAFLGLVGHLGALGQGLEALAHDGAVMDEDVLRAVIGGDEPVTLVIAEPLDCSGRHLASTSCAANAEASVKQRRER